jgi:hypothetical protein
MLKDYRDWLESELKLLGNASHHAYSFGQANMAQRAIEQLDALLAKKVPLLLDEAEAANALSALDALPQPDPPLVALRDQLRHAIDKRDAAK